jgi:hypothetical protein
VSATVTASRLVEAARAALRPSEPKIPSAELVERLKPEFPDINEDRLGRALVGAGWTRRQWRTSSGRVRGYAPPLFREVPEIAAAPPEAPAPAAYARQARIIRSPGTGTGPHGAL